MNVARNPEANHHETVGRTRLIINVQMLWFIKEGNVLLSRINVQMS